MKMNFKDPNFYYIMVPVLAALWAIMAGLVFYPKSVKAWNESKKEYITASGLMDELVTLQPERLTYKVDENNKPEEFDFNKTVSQFAEAFSISSSNYNFSSRDEAKRAGRITKSASISIKNIDIQKMTQFLSALLLRWPDLKCERLSFNKVKNSKDNWQVDMALTYYY